MTRPASSSLLWQRFTLLSLLPVTLVMLTPTTAFGWGAGMHATLNAHAHDRMEQRWKTAIDRSFLLYGSFGPDVWYILEDDFMESICGSACGPENGSHGQRMLGRLSARLLLQLCPASAGACP